MLRLKTRIHDVEDENLAIPGAQPLTLLQVSNDNLPYACQCPLCGGIFEIPKGTLYEIEEDNIVDEDLGIEPPEQNSESGSKSRTKAGFFEDSAEVEPSHQESLRQEPLPES